MSISSYPFHFLSLKLPNKGMDFPFLPLKPPNKGRDEYSKIIFFIPFHSIPFHSLLLNKALDVKVEEGVVYLYWVSKLINSNIIIKRKKNKKIKKKVT